MAKRRKSHQTAINSVNGDLFPPESSWEPDTTFPDLSHCKHIGVDVETNDPNLKSLGPGGVRGDGYCVGISLSTDDGFSTYLPIRHLSGTNLDEATVVRYVRDQLKHDNLKVGANLLYDLEWLWTLGIEVKGPLYDVQVAESLIDEERKAYSLDSLCRSYIGRPKEETILRMAADIFGVDPKSGLWKLDPIYVGQYAEADAIDPLVIMLQQERAINDQDLTRVINVEMRLLRLLFRMRIQGVPVDLSRKEELSREWTQTKMELQGKLDIDCGFHLNIWSGPELARVCDSLKIVYPRTDLGNPSFADDFIKHHDHKFLKSVKRLRKFDRLTGTFVDDLIDKYSVRGRIHAQFHQVRGDKYGTRYGRFSSSNPNLQQIPSRDEELAHLIRSLFIPDPGLMWAKHDYSQQEPRVLVHYAYISGCEGAAEFRDMYIVNPDLDFYEPIANRGNIKRRESKDMTLGRCYGMGKKKMAKKLNRSIESAQAVLRIFDQTVPFVKEMADLTMHRAQSKGFIKTYLGRRSRFNSWEPGDRWNRMEQGEDCTPRNKEDAEGVWGPNIQRAHTHKALNRLIQGTSADMMKLGMLSMYEEFDIVPYLTVHDETDSGVENRDQAEVMSEVMEECVDLTVPLKVDLDVGRSWK